MRPLKVIAQQTAPVEQTDDENQLLAAEPDDAAASSGDEGSTTVTLSERERALIVPEVAALLGGLRGEEARRDYLALKQALEAGEVSGPELTRLESFLELSLSTGRVRQHLGALAEETVRRVFERTPRGQSLVGSATAVTQALSGMIGQPLTDVQVTVIRPGTYRLVLESERYRFSLALAPGGAQVESLELNL